MLIKRRIVVAGLDGPIRSIVKECLPPAHIGISDMPFKARELLRKLDELDLGF